MFTHLDYKYLRRPLSHQIASKMALLHMIPIASVDIAAAPQTFPRMRAWLAEAASVRFDAVSQRAKCAALEVRI
jgi:hypothetical protein